MFVERNETGSSAKLSTKKSIKSIAIDQSRVESRKGLKVESIGNCLGSIV